MQSDTGALDGVLGERLTKHTLKRHELLLLGAVLSLPAASQAFAQGVSDGDTTGTLDETDTLDEMSLDQLLNVDVTIATKTAEPVERTPAIVTLVTRQDIEEQGWTSLGELLEHLPDFMLARLPAAETALVVRGMSSREGVLVMLNGVSLNNPLDGGFAFFDMPLGAVERVEIIRGPGSALYGGSAVLAVVDVITDPASRSGRNLRVDASYATENSLRLQTRYDEIIPYGVVSVGLSLTRRKDADAFIERDLVQQLEDLPTGQNARDTYGAIAADDNRRSERADGLVLNLGITGTEGVTDGLSIHGLVLGRETRPRLSRLYALVQPDQLSGRDLAGLLSLRWPIPVGDQVRITPSAYYVQMYNRMNGQITRPYEWTDDEDFDGVTERWPEGRIEGRTYTIHRTGGEVQGELRIGSAHTVSLGVAYERASLDNVQYFSNSSNDINGEQLSINGGQVVNVQEFDPQAQAQTFWIDPQVDRSLLAAYLQEMWRIRGDLAMTVGVRYDHYTDFGSAVSPRAVLVYNPRENLFIKGMAGEAFKPPTFLALYDATVTDRNERRHYGNPDLQAATAQTAEVQVGYRFGDGLLLQASTYYVRTQNEVVFDQSLYSYENASKRTSEGVSLEARGNWGGSWGHIRPFGHYTFNLTEGGIGSGAPLYPRHQVQLGVTSQLRLRDGPRKPLSTLALGGSALLRSPHPREDGDMRAPIGSQLLLTAHARIAVLKDVFMSAAAYVPAGDTWVTPVDKSLADTLPGDIPRERAYVELSVGYTY